MRRRAWWQGIAAALGLGPRPPAPVPQRRIPDGLWHRTLADYPFLHRLPRAQQQRLRQLSDEFLRTREFTGAAGLTVTDAMATAIAAQACVLLLHRRKTPARALRVFGDFVGIVLYPGDVLAARSALDEATGVVHHWREALAGEAMPGGPVVLSWQAVQQARRTPEETHCNGGDDHHAGLAPVPDTAPHPAFNVVLHEFAHKLDMAHDGHANGSPPLPAHWADALGHLLAAARLPCPDGPHSPEAAPAPGAARALWARIWERAYADFCDAVTAHERFSQPAPWLDAYAATSAAEFFAVACEAHWMQPRLLQSHMPHIAAALQALFQPAQADP